MTDALRGDPRRRASNVVRGFEYQFWRTVLVWIELGADDVLYVEGAEDFDVVGSDEAAAVQVRDDRASGPLTLGGAKTIRALGNFWAVRNENRGRKVCFHFITTAEAGSEGAFEGNNGVEVWNLCARSPLDACTADVIRIRDFLLTRTSLDQTLARFLKAAPLEEVFHELVQPVEWLFAQPDLEAVQEIVIGKLLEVGRPRGLTRADAGHLANDLHQAVVAAATRPTPERLTPIDFAERLDRAVNIEIPRQLLRRPELLIHEAFSRLLASASDVPAAGLSILAHAPENFLPPVLRKTPLLRPHLIQQVVAALNSGVAFIAGGAGTGKTTIARQAVDDKAPLFWAALRGKSVRDIAISCRDIVQRVSAQQSAATVVLDDLNPDGDARILEDPLGQLAGTIASRSGALVIIAYRPPGPRLASILGLSPVSRVSLTPFQEAEINQLLVLEGCPASRAAKLARVVHVQTGGHPQLVTVRVDALKAASFPEPAAMDIVASPPEIDDARAEALRFARSALPEGARTLLYRLSLAIPELKRSHALRIAAASPSITQAADMLDQLLGAWVEEPMASRYRVSALISRAGQDMLTPDEVRQIHANIAAALLAEGELTPFEFAGIVFHALAGRAETELATAAKLFMTAPKEVKETLGEEIAPIVAIGMGEDGQLPIKSKPVRQFFRLLQWEVAGLTAPRSLSQLAQLMEEEFAAASSDIAETMPRMLYLTKLLLQVDFKIAPEAVVHHTLELLRLAEAANAQGIPVGTGVPPLHPELPRSIFLDLFAAALIPRLRRVDDLRTLIRAVDSLRAEDRAALLSTFATDDGELRVLFLSPWAGLKRGVDDESYDEYARAVEDALAAGRRWNHKPWMRAAARTLSALLDEMLHDSDKAAAVVSATAHEIGWSPNLEDQLALIAFNRHDDAAALAIWQRILPEWRSAHTVRDMQPILSARCAAIAAAHLDKWDLAADFFRRAVDELGASRLHAWKVGLQADLGYALWRCSRRHAAVVVFREVVEALEMLPNRPESFAEYAVQKLAGHVLASLADRAAPLTPPLPGMCSNLAPSESIKTLPPTPAACLWFFLYHLARQAGDDGTAIACADKVRTAPFAFARSVAARDALERHLESSDLRGTLKLAESASVEMSKAVSRQGLPPYESDPPDLSGEVTEDLMAVFLRPALSAALLRARVIGRSISELVDAWRNDLAHVDPRSTADVAAVGAVSAMVTGALAAVVRDENEESETRVYASACLLGRDDTAPEDVLYAQLIISDVARSRELMRTVSGAAFDMLVRRDWMRLCNAPFQLRSPQIYVPAIRRACETDATGWPAAAMIMLTAAPATTLRIPESMRRRVVEASRQSSEGSAAAPGSRE
jgi:hypothetical protein